MFEVEHDGTNDLFNYALQEDSYCIDAGTTNFNQNLLDHFYTGVCGDSPDIGSVEFCDDIILSSDLNNDFNLNVLDVLILINIIVDNESFNGSGDLNHDGTINVLDILQLINVILVN